MRNLFILLFFAGIFFLANCSVSKKASSSSAISYERDIAPIMLDRCTPCHYPDQGKKKFLDTYGAVKTNIDEIIARVKMDPSEKEFMPFKSKKEPLSDSLIQVFVTWKETGMSK
ncbi:MAG: hypothetical protein R2879_20450 [Saprospiraceae bacterium]